MKRFQWPKDRSAALRHFVGRARKEKDRLAFVREALRSIVCRATRLEQDAAEDLGALHDQVHGRQQPVDAEAAAARARELVELGWHLLDQEKGQEAVATFRMAFGLAMHHDQAETGMAATAGLVRALLRTGHASDAEAFVERLRSVAPQATALAVLLAQIRMHQKRHAEAREILLQVESEMPVPGSALHTDLAVCASALGQAAEAEKYARQAVATNPGHAPALVVLFNLLLEGARLDEAERLLPTLQAVMPNDSYVESLPRLIRSLRARPAAEQPQPNSPGS
jgi:Tfp pilus assembly protein PilF